MSERQVSPIICWFRRDLRVKDNPALYHAAQTGIPVIPLFVVDTDLIATIPSDGAVFDFQAECLRDLSENIESLGGRLIIRSGKLFEVFSGIINETDPAAIYFNRDYEPNALKRDAAAADFFRGRGIEVKSFDDVVIHHPDEIKTAEGRPYVVFTPYSARWQKTEKRKPVGRPSRVTTPKIVSETIPGGKELGRSALITNPIARGGERLATASWHSFLNERLPGYAGARDLPHVQGTSMMSPYLRFGCISASRMYTDILDASLSGGGGVTDSAAKYASELIWREFYTAVLYHLPHTARSNYRREFDKLNWNPDEKVFRAWTEGRTGFPLVDAGMRQLNATGWMHNRVRMVVASFLTKDLLVDWRRGEEYFSTKLLDIEKASNVGGWQWSASTGVDPRPLRIFNPTLQSRRFDSDGDYIRQWVPELKRVPSKFVHEPSTMPPAMQKELGVVIGRDYPSPIVNHRDASLLFKREYAAARSNSRVRSASGGIQHETNGQDR